MYACAYNAYAHIDIVHVRIIIPPRFLEFHCPATVMAEGNSALVNFLSDPATLAALAAVAAGAAWYISSRPSPVKPPIPLDNQSIELPVSRLWLIRPQPNSIATDST